MKYSISLLLILLFISLSFGQNVFVWDYDQDYTIPNLDQGRDWGVEEGIVNSICELGINFDVATELPNDLSGYDIVFALTGLWCWT